MHVIFDLVTTQQQTRNAAPANARSERPRPERERPNQNNHRSEEFDDSHRANRYQNSFWIFLFCNNIYSIVDKLLPQAAQIKNQAAGWVMMKMTLATQMLRVYWCNITGFIFQLLNIIVV